MYGVFKRTLVLFLTESDYLYWADSDHGTVTRIRRDGTGRQVVVEHFEAMESCLLYTSRCV